MSRICRIAPWARPMALATFLTVFCLASHEQAFGQFVSQQVGGVSIDAQGVVKKVNVDQLGELLRVRKDAFQPVSGDLQKQALRKVSLRQLEAAIAAHRKDGTPITDDMRYLAGLQRIQYVFVYPEQNDIVLAGPGEGWRISPEGEIVGATTNRPVILLDDLLVALRAIEALRQTGISCSIDPTADGLSRLHAIAKTLRTAPADPQPLMTEIEQALGPQTITVTGVPDTTHFARVLVAADYRMKRLAMAFDKPPIDGLPDFLQMVKVSRGSQSMMPRWWLAADYDALVTDGAGLAWELPRAGVKAMTEDEVLNASGQRQRTGQSSPLAKKWADNMTAHYDELSTADPIFGQLRNCMDLAVVAALISQHKLNEKCGWDMSLLLNPDLKAQRFNAPHTVDTAASVVQKRTGLVISASGGVQINPWPLLESPRENAKLGDTRTQSAATSNHWWWN